jgi:hypothetical protein
MRGQIAGFDMTDQTESQAFVNLYTASLLAEVAGAAPSMFGEEGVVCPLIVYTDLDVSW